MQSVEIAKTGAIVLAPILIDEITRIALTKFPIPGHARLYFRGAAITLTSLLLTFISSKGFYSFPHGLFGIYLQIQGIKAKEYLNNLERNQEILAGWIQRLKQLDNSKTLQVLKFSHTLKESSIIKLRKEIDRLLHDKIHNYEKLVELIDLFEKKILKIEPLLNDQATRT